MLDALIGNTDRHHENWGFIQSIESGCQILRLAPTYDHASSLGRELTDEERERRLNPKKDKRVTMEAYVKKTKSALWSSQSRNLVTIQRFCFLLLLNAVITREHSVPFSPSNL